MLCFGLEGVNGVEIGDKEEGRRCWQGDQHGNKQGHWRCGREEAVGCAGRGGERCWIDQGERGA